MFGRPSPPVDQHTSGRIAELVERGVTSVFDRMIAKPKPIATPTAALDRLVVIAADRHLVGGSAAAVMASRAVRRSTKVASFIPSARLLAAAATSGQAVVQVRNGLRELEVLTSLEVHRRRQLDLPLDRTDIVNRVLTAYLGKPVTSARAAVPKLAARWVGRAVRPDSERAIRHKAQRWINALTT
jgi:hypothetical protein